MFGRTTLTYYCYAGNTAILVGVYGPIEVKQQRLLIDKIAVEVYYRPKAGMPSKIPNFYFLQQLKFYYYFLDVGDRLYESKIKTICESMLVSNLYPRSAITINIQEIESNGGEVKRFLIPLTKLLKRYYCFRLWLAR